MTTRGDLVTRRWSRAGLLGLGLLLAAGCAKATTTSMQLAPEGVPRPDRVLVYDFAVNAGEVTLDRGLGPRLAREGGAATQTEEELRIGRAVAEALARHLVEELRGLGIEAARATGGPLPTDITVSITGRFLSIDQGDRTKRTLVGFGLGGSEVRTWVQIYQSAGARTRLLAEGETVTESNMKPGLGVMLPVGAVAGTLATTAVVAGGLTVLSEAALATVEADAKRTAKDIAERVAGYYRRHGWLP